MPIQNGKYVAPTWNNNAPPPVNASELQAVCDTLETCQNTIEQIQQSVETVTVKPGSFMWWTQTTAPDGWLICDGSRVSRTTYSDLFSVIGTTFGSGDGSTTFTLPDMRATFVRGAGSQNGYSATFGIKKDATSINYGLTNPTSTSAFTNDTDKINDLPRLEVLAGSTATTRGYQYFVRPYNLALTPVIKY